ncbi:DegT/DnrJ/EryC1/StrS family aminotransferase [Lewinella sp. IMCC34183]|uniref:DegT/DnrJ/EryC1/StrS family aminotransferase n=1 Tax=Lewinella sp. IMCC34183 TaxID=2248762 RepID=UPI0018E53BCB|nr:DegT/DnrJ/EryC1/StrS family aminotransferase [Lewinella sp. IMCC34183]
MNQPAIQVSKTYLPPREDYHALLESVWDSQWVTNNGPLLRELERTLATRFDSDTYVVTNGTVALQLAIRSLSLTGSAITTPFSYVATTNALLWEGVDPIFVDVDPDWYCLDPTLVEAAIRPDTTAILATHVYGYPCDHTALAAIAERHGLALIYDAAHAFDVKVDGRSIVTWGSASTLSFHATKVFHTIEGGAVVAGDAELLARVDLMRSFGHTGREYLGLGINGKTSELHCGIGLLNLRQLAANRVARRDLSELYRDLLRDLPLRCLDPADFPGLEYNYAYFPIFCATNSLRESLVERLNAHNIFPRRYFEPSLNELDFLPTELRVACPVSEHASRTALCLPLYPDLDPVDVHRITSIIRETVVQWA